MKKEVILPMTKDREHRKRNLLDFLDLTIFIGSFFISTLAFSFWIQTGDPQWIIASILLSLGTLLLIRILADRGSRKEITPEGRRIIGEMKEKGWTFSEEDEYCDYFHGNPEIGDCMACSQFDLRRMRCKRMIEGRH